MGGRLPKRAVSRDGRLEQERLGAMDKIEEGDRRGGAATPLSLDDGVLALVRGES